MVCCSDQVLWHQPVHSHIPMLPHKQKASNGKLGGKEASAWYVAIHRLFVPCDAYMIVFFK